MFTITHELLSRLDALRQERYHRQLLSHLRTTLAGHIQSRADAELIEIIKVAVEKAQRFGVTTGHAVMRYVTLAVVINPNFDEMPEVRRLFDLEGFDPDYKVHLLSDLLIAHLDRI